MHLAWHGVIFKKALTTAKSLYSYFFVPIKRKKYLSKATKLKKKSYFMWIMDLTFITSYSINQGTIIIMVLFTPISIFNSLCIKCISARLFTPQIVWLSSLLKYCSASLAHIWDIDWYKFSIVQLFLFDSFPHLQKSWHQRILSNEK